MRSIKNTVLRVKRLEIPVGIASARQESKMGLRLLHRTCRTPIARVPFCEKHERRLEEKQIVRGFEVAEGRYLPLSDAELADAVEEDSEAIAIKSFVPAASVPAQLAIGVYYLLPSKLPVCAREYATLQQTLEETGLVGLAHFHWRSEWIAAISAAPETRALLLTRLAPVGELIEHHPIDAQLLETWPTASELDKSRRAVLAMRRARPGAALRSAGNEKLRELIEQKLRKDTTLEKTLRRSVAGRR